MGTVTCDRGRDNFFGIAVGHGFLKAEMIPCFMAYLTSSELVVIPSSSMIRVLWNRTVRWVICST
jgi:hypothetical protein